MSKKSIQLNCEAQRKGSLWEVIVLTEGLSENGVFYPAEVLKRDCERLYGASSYLYQLGDNTFEHLPEALQQNYNGLVGNLIGWFRNPHVGEAEGKIAIIADLYIHKAAQQVREFFKDCWEQGRKIGFSITAWASSEKKEFQGKMVDWVTELWFMSVDPVSHPAVGDAQAIRLLESNREDENKMDEKIKEQILELARKIVPESTKEIGELDDGESPSSFSRIDAISLVSQMVESLDPQSFPESDMRAQLARLRDAIEDEDDETAGNILTNILSLELRGQQLEMLKKLESLLDEEKVDKALEVITQLTESKVPQEAEETSTEETKTNDERLAERFGEEKAAELKALLGDDAFQYLPLEEQKEDTALLWDKLEKLQMLISDGEIEAAQQLLKTILGGEYSEPSEPEEEYPLPDEYPLPEPRESEENQEGETLPIDELEEKEAGENLDETGVRLTKIELEKLLGEAQLPEATKAKIRKAFEKKTASTEELDAALKRELDYLSALEFQYEDPRVTAVQEERKSVQEAFKNELAILQTEREEERKNVQEAFKNELAILQKEREELQAQITGMKEAGQRSETEALVETKMREANLARVSESRVRKRFAGEIASEEDIRKAIAEEVTLATQIIAEMASTVVDFGEKDEPEEDFTEEKAEEKVHQFFASRMGIELEVSEG